MPKSKLREKVKRKRKVAAAVAPEVILPSAVESPKWLVPVMLANFLIGLLWIVIFYISSTAYPIPGIGAWNMVVGFGFVGVGFTLATRWR
jgi:hypothetical protein